MYLPFNNDTSIVTKKIVAAQLKHDKLKKRLAIFAIILATMLMSTILLLVSGIAVVNSKGGNGATGSFHALISGLNKEQFVKLNEYEELELIGLTASMGTYKNNDQSLNISYSDSNALALNSLSVSEGRMPEQENEIVLEKEYLKSQNLDTKIGGAITLTMPGSQKECEFIISGYLKTTASGTSRNLYAAVVSEKYFESVDGWNTIPTTAMIRVHTGRITSKGEIQSTIKKIAASIGAEDITSINEAYLNLTEPSFFMFFVVLGGLGLIIIAGVLVIYCIFYISIINAIKEYGQLRTIGMTGKQIKRLIFREGFTLSIISIPIGLTIGTLLSYLLIPQGFEFTNLLWVWPFVTVLAYATVRLSIRKPAKIAAAVSPIEAYRYVDSKIGKEKWAARLKRITPISLAKRQLVINKKRNILTITSLILTGILLFSLSSVLSSINAKDMSRSGFPRGQFIISISNEKLMNHPLEQVQENNPFTNKVSNTLTEISGLEMMTEYHNLPVATEPQSSESNASIVSYSRDDMKMINDCSVDGKKIDYDALTEHNQLIIGKPGDLEKYLNIRAEIGKTITLKVFNGTVSKNVDFEIAAILDENKIGNNSDKIDMLMLPIDAMNHLVSCDTTYQYAIKVSDDMEEKAEEEIEMLLEKHPELSMESLSSAISQNNNFIQGMRIFLSVMVTFIGCFAIMNLVNTILTSIVTRQREFALMHSVGMSRKQIFSMIRYEGLITISIGLIFSVIIGGGLGYGLCLILKNKLMTYLNYKFPIGVMIIYCLFVIFCTLIVINTAIKKQNKLSLIEQLRK